MIKKSSLESVRQWVPLLAVAGMILHFGASGQPKEATQFASQLKPTTKTNELTMEYTTAKLTMTGLSEANVQEYTTAELTMTGLSDASVQEYTTTTLTMTGQFALGNDVGGQLHAIEDLESPFKKLDEPKWTKEETTVKKKAKDLWEKMDEDDEQEASLSEYKKTIVKKSESKTPVLSKEEFQLGQKMGTKDKVLVNSKKKTAKKGVLASDFDF